VFTYVPASVHTIAHGIKGYAEILLGSERFSPEPGGEKDARY
jgi:hypothetical protein